MCKKVNLNYSLKLEKTIDKALNRLESSTTDFRLCKMCSDSNVRTDELKSIIDSIMTNPENFVLVKELIRNICTYYFTNGKNKDVTNLEFLTIVFSPTYPNSPPALSAVFINTLPETTTLFIVLFTGEEVIPFTPDL